jgi:hypothetical protein
MHLSEWENLAEGAPDVYAGSGEAENAPQHLLRDDPDSRPPMILTTTYASNTWRDTYKHLEPSDPKYVLVIHLGIAEYPKSPRLLFDEKVVLGTHAEQDLSFLGRGDVPVEVVHVTALLLDRDGNVLRAGSEGISAKRGHLIADLLGLTESTANYELGTLSTEPREDMPGRPLKWRVALDDLLNQILAPN